MKKEEEKQYVGKVDIVVTTNRRDITLKGTISEVQNRIARSVLDAICDVNFYDAKVSKEDNSTTITFTDNIGETLTIDELEERVNFMKHALAIIGDIMVNLSILENMRKDYEGTKKKLLEHKESSD